MELKNLVQEAQRFVNFKLSIASRREMLPTPKTVCDHMQEELNKWLSECKYSFTTKVKTQLTWSVIGDHPAYLQFGSPFLKTPLIQLELVMDGSAVKELRQPRGESDRTLESVVEEILDFNKDRTIFKCWELASRDFRLHNLLCPNCGSPADTRGYEEDLCYQYTVVCDSCDYSALPHVAPDVASAEGDFVDSWYRRDRKKIKEDQETAAKLNRLGAEIEFALEQARSLGVAKATLLRFCTQVIEESKVKDSLAPHYPPSPL